MHLSTRVLCAYGRDLLALSHHLEVSSVSVNGGAPGPCNSAYHAADLQTIGLDFSAVATYDRKPALPTSGDQCKKDGWKSSGGVFVVPAPHARLESGLEVRSRCA